MYFQNMGLNHFSKQNVGLTNTYATPYMFHDTVELKSEHCQNVFSSFFNDLKITTDTSKQVETATKGQHINPNWKIARSRLITASVFGDVFKRVTDQPDCLVKRILDYNNGQQNLRVKSLEWGRSNEK